MRLRSGSRLAGWLRRRLRLRLGCRGTRGGLSEQALGFPVVTHRIERAAPLALTLGRLKRAVRGCKTGRIPLVRVDLAGVRPRALGVSACRAREPREGIADDRLVPQLCVRLDGGRQRTLTILLSSELQDARCERLRALGGRGRGGCGLGRNRHWWRWFRGGGVRVARGRPRRWRVGVRGRWQSGWLVVLCPNRSRRAQPEPPRDENADDEHEDRGDRERCHLLPLRTGGLFGRRAGPGGLHGRADPGALCSMRLGICFGGPGLRGGGLGARPLGPNLVGPRLFRARALCRRLLGGRFLGSCLLRSFLRCAGSIGTFLLGAQGGLARLLLARLFDCGAFGSAHPPVPFPRGLVRRVPARRAATPVGPSPRGPWRLPPRGRRPRQSPAAPPASPGQFADAAGRSVPAR